MGKKAKRIIDLTNEPGSRLALAASAVVRELKPGLELHILTRDDPTLLMESLNLQYHAALAWRAESRGAHWESRVELAAETQPRDVLEALVRDHRRLDAMLGKALRRLNAGDMDGANPMLRSFIDGLRSHLRAEDEMLAPVLGPQPAPEPLQIMLREHGELVQQLDALVQALEDVAEGEPPQAWEVEPFVALLSGTLAKHEHREEDNLFPLWRRRLDTLPEKQRDSLLVRLQQAIGAS